MDREDQGIFARIVIEYCLGRRIRQDPAIPIELNLLFWVGNEKRDAMRTGGFDIAPYQGNETWMLPVPATFIVGRDGLVKARYIDADYRRRMDLDLILGVLEQLQPEVAGVSLS